MPQKPESRFKEIVARDLKTLPYTWFVKVQQLSIRGTPDFLCCIRGKFVALELKSTPKSAISPLQDWTLKEIANNYGLALIAYPGNWNNTFMLLEEIANDVSMGEDGENEDPNEDPDSKLIQVDYDRVNKKVRN